MYDRRVNGEVLEFGHEGVLYRNSFMMYDKQSESLWLHVTGEALKGPLRGTKLQFIASEISAWSDWKYKHPLSGVLLGEKAEGFMGSFNLETSQESYGLSIGSGREVSLLYYTFLAAVPLFNYDDVLVIYNAESTSALAFDNQGLHFEALSGEAALMRDTTTGSIWQQQDGVCISGDSQGQFLVRAVATPWLAKRWLGFFPDGKVVKLEEIEEN